MISEYTQAACRVLCFERWAAMEVSRLDWKLAKMTENGGFLTEQQKVEDARLKEASAHYLRSARGDRP